MSAHDIVFRWHFRVREAEVDRQQVVFNSRYLEYADIVIGEYFRSRGIPLIGEGLPLMHVRRAAVDYLQPLRIDDAVVGAMCRPQHRRTSITLRIEFRTESDGPLAAVAEIVYVNVDPDSHRAHPFADDFVAKVCRQG